MNRMKRSTTTETKTELVFSPVEVINFLQSKQLTPGHPFFSVEVTGLGVSKGMKITIRHESRNEDENIQLS